MYALGHGVTTYRLLEILSWWSLHKILNTSHVNYLVGSKILNTSQVNYLVGSNFQTFGDPETDLYANT